MFVCEYVCDESQKGVSVCKSIGRKLEIEISVINSPLLTGARWGRKDSPICRVESAFFKLEQFFLVYFSELQ